MSPAQLAALLGAGTAATVAQLCLTAAYSYAAASEISIYDYSQICFAALLGYIVFGQMADRWSFLGYAVIAGAAAGVYATERGTRRTARDREDPMG